MSFSQVTDRRVPRPQSVLWINPSKFRWIFSCSSSSHAPVKDLLPIETWMPWFGGDLNMKLLWNAVQRGLVVQFPWEFMYYLDSDIPICWRKCLHGKGWGCHWGLLVRVEGWVISRRLEGSWGLTGSGEGVGSSAVSLVLHRMDQAWPLLASIEFVRHNFICLDPQRWHLLDKLHGTEGAQPVLDAVFQSEPPQEGVIPCLPPIKSRFEWSACSGMSVISALTQAGQCWHGPWHLASWDRHH